MPTSTNVLGKRLLDRYKADPPTASWSQIVTAHAPAGWISDRDFGLATLIAFERGDATVGDVDAVLGAGWITQDEYDAILGVAGE